MHVSHKKHWSCAQCHRFHCCSRHKRRLDDVAEDRTPPGPGAVSDNVCRVGDEWSVVSVELARLVTGTVVVRVTDRWHRTLGQTLDTTTHLDSARHFVDHLLSWMIHPLPTCVTKLIKAGNFTSVRHYGKRNYGVKGKMQSKGKRRKGEGLKAEKWGKVMENRLHIFLKVSVC